MASIFLLCDARPSSGIGHVSRMKGLAEGIQEKYSCIINMGLLGVSEISNDLKTFFYPSVPIAVPVNLDNIDDIKTLYKLTTSFTEPVSILIIDSYSIPFQVQIKLKAMAQYLVIIDDFNHLPIYEADLIVNYNTGAETLSYKCSAPNCKVLLGSQYVILNKDICNLIPKKNVFPIASRILITMGGSNQSSIIKTILNSIEKIFIYYQSKTDLSLTVRVLSGKHLLRDIENANYSYPVELVSDCKSIAPHLTWADLAISAGGITKYELAYASIPAVLIAVVNHQDPLCKEFVKHGTAQYIGRKELLTEEIIKDKLLDIIFNTETRKKMTLCGAEYIDGNGISRILEQLPGISG